MKMRTILKTVLKVNVAKRRWTPKMKLIRTGIATKTGTGFVLDISSIKIWGMNDKKMLFKRLRHLPSTAP